MRAIGRRLLCAVLCLGFCFGMAACGDREETDEELTETFSQLLAADFEVYYLFYSDGLPVDQNVTQQVDGADYHPVVSTEYEDLNDLRELLERVYAQESQVEAHLEVKDPHGVPLLAEVDGKLYRSATRDIYALGYEVDDTSIRLEERGEEQASFVFLETGMDGSLYETHMTMVKTSQGWRLEAPRSEAQREVVREGSGESSAIAQGEARQTAESFLEALKAGDAAALAEMTQGEEEVWSGVQVSRGEITEVREELDSQGDYLVSLQVEKGGGVLEEGEQEYRLYVQFDALSGKVSPVYFQPSAREYYNWLPYSSRDSEPAGEVEEFIGLYGTQTFDSPDELSPEVITEFAIVRMAETSGQWDQVYTAEEVAAQVEETFGISGFDGSGTPFYSAEQGGYIMWGRGGSSFNMLMEMPIVQDGRAEVKVGFYKDLLCTVPESSITYVLEENQDGGWRFLSASVSFPAG
jgi:hypothetical protein